MSFGCFALHGVKRIFSFWEFGLSLSTEDIDTKVNPGSSVD